MSDKCKSCGASILWTETEQGRAMPVDPEPLALGNVVLSDSEDPRGPIRSSLVRRGERGEREGRYVSHFVTCPNAKLHRRVKP